MTNEKLLKTFENYDKTGAFHSFKTVEVSPLVAHASDPSSCCSIHAILVAVPETLGHTFAESDYDESDYVVHMGVS